MFCLVPTSASLLMKLVSDQIDPIFHKFFYFFKVLKFGTLVMGICIVRKNDKSFLLLAYCEGNTYQQVGLVLSVARLYESGLNSKQCP